MCVTDRHDMTLVFKVALNLNTANQLTIQAGGIYQRSDCTIVLPSAKVDLSLLIVPKGLKWVLY